MDDDQPQDEGVPAWVMTFADLMSLLMCFFVLLLAFSEMDAQKFKQLSGSMKEAFGVQAEIKSDFIPKGTSVVTQEFSPGRPEPTPLNEIRQFTIDTTKSTLDHTSSLEDEGQGKIMADEKVERDAEAIREILKDEIEEGRASVSRQGMRIIVQIHEQGSFRSGEDQLQFAFVSTIDKLSSMISRMPGVVQITGHTDDVPIATSRFRSNWDLSAARAVSVAHRMMENAAIDPRRFVVTGLADTAPQVPNDSAKNRAMNRRVQITIVRAAEPQPEEAAQEDGETAPSAAEQNPEERATS